MSLAIAIGSNRDITLKTNSGGGTDFLLVEDALATEQAFRIHLTTKQGEDSVAPTLGLPVRSLRGPLNETALESAIRATLSKDYRFLSMDDFKAAFDSDDDRLKRLATVEFNLRGTDGTEILFSAPITL